MNNLSDRVVINPEIMLGKPVIMGTRITVESIVEELASGYSMEQVLQAHPNLQKEDILAALHYASALMKNEKVYTTAT